jgi:hypothetical protein
MIPSMREGRSSNEVGASGGENGFSFAEVGVGFAAALTATPLFQTSFVPDLTQVNFLPADIDVEPAFVHFVPAFTAAVAEIDVVARIKRLAIETSRQLLAREDNKFTI